jgi:multicomponent Na+:H+ antiporter subunit B
MNSFIMRTTSGTVLVSALLFSVYVLLRGHNEPGGGFVGGLIAAGGLAVFVLPRGRTALRSVLFVPPPSLLGVGLCFALGSGVGAIARGQAFLTHQWTTFAGLELGTPLLFDLGVYLVVVGAVLSLLSLYLEH